MSHSFVIAVKIKKIMRQKYITHLQMGQGDQQGQLLHLFQEDPEDKETINNLPIVHLEYNSVFGYLCEVFR